MINEQRAGLRHESESVSVADMARLLEKPGAREADRVFSTAELDLMAHENGQLAQFAELYAVKRACLRFFGPEAASGAIDGSDFTVVKDAGGTYRIECGPKARKLMAWYRLADISVSISRNENGVSALATASVPQTEVPLIGRMLYRLIPIRRKVVLDNLHQVFGGRVSEEEIVRLAQAFYAHLGRLLSEFVKFSFLSEKRRQKWITVENGELALEAVNRGRGLIVLASHLGNWELAPVGAFKRFPQYRGRLHVVRRTLNPPLLDDLVTKRTRVGLAAINKFGALAKIRKLLAAGHVVIFPFDQHASPKEGVLVDFLGHPAWTHRSLAAIAKATGAPVVPAVVYRDEKHRHVLRFEQELRLVERDSVHETIRSTTRLYNEFLEGAILEHPEQWIWLHRRWKETKTLQTPGE